MFDLASQSHYKRRKDGESIRKRLVVNTPFNLCRSSVLLTSHLNKDRDYMEMCIDSLIAQIL